MLGYDAARIWSSWAEDLVHRTADAGHFMAEQDPDLVIATVQELLSRRREPNPEGARLLEVEIAPHLADVQPTRRHRRLRARLLKPPWPAGQPLPGARAA